MKVFVPQLLIARAILALSFLVGDALPARLLGQATSANAGQREAARTPPQSLTGRQSADGHREVLAIPAAGAIRIDGNLDEEIWKRAEPATDFVQSEPSEGQLSTERTEVRVVFDDDNLYIGARLFDRDPGHLVINDIRKDFREEDQDDFEVLLDTFGDRRNGYVFSTNVLGARHDRQVALEGREINQSWDAVWEVRTQRSAEGWTAEMRIPFRALRFNKSTDKTWGVNFSRHIRRKNEVAFWSPVPRSYNMNRVSLAGNLAGLLTGSAGRDLRIKPYIAANTTREVGTLVSPRPAFANAYDVGADIRTSITSGLTMDVTINPDFGQVEADEQQVNLTQFSQFFPEKRDFFLENSGVFYVGDAARNNRVSTMPTPDEDNLLFFSRRIGLNDDGRQLPILGGLRVTGKLTSSSRLGILTIQEREDGSLPATNSSVIRFRQNLGKVGNDLGFFMMQTLNTSGADTGVGRVRGDYYNRVFGIDKNLRIGKSLDWNSYLVKTQTPGVDSGDYAWRTSLNHEGNFFHFKGGLMQLGDGFQNDLGYYRRVGIRKYFTETGLRPRSIWLHDHGVREFHPHVVWSYIENLKGNIEQKYMHTGWSVFFNEGSVIELSVNPAFNRFEEDFLPNPNMTQPIPAGGYGWTEYQIYATSDASRLFSTDTRVTWGGLWAGTQRSVGGTVTFRPSYRFYTRFGLQRTAAALDIPRESFVNNIMSLRTNYSFTTNMFIDALSQYDRTSKQFNANVRFNIIHHPLSDLFIVYNDQRFLTTDNFRPGRSVIVKFTQMLAF